MKRPLFDNFRTEILKIAAYEVEGPSDLIRLDANENPYPPPGWLMDALAEKCRHLSLNRYPDPSARKLRSLLAERLGWEVEGLMLGNGSDELIAMICTAFGRPGDCAVIPVPTFAMYRLIGLTCGWEVEEVLLNDSFDLDGEALLERIRAKRPGLVIIAYPNNPTGNCFSEEVVRGVLEEAPGIVVLDEAYFDFSGRTFLPLLQRHPNLIILRSLSKIGLAALRLGVLLADPQVARELNKVRLPYNVSTFSQEAATLVLENPSFLEEEIEAILAGRGGIAKEMGTLKGVQPFDSDANFILFRTERDSDDIFRGVRAEGVLVRNLGRPGPLRNCLRVTVGTPEENRAFIKALRKSLVRGRH